MILALDAALAGCSAGVVDGGAVLAERRARGARGHLAALPAMAQAALAEAGVRAGQLAMVAVTVGPGSFTGLRAALALAHGIGLAAGAPVVGVTVGEALAGDGAPGRALWVAIDTRRGRVFLDRDGDVQSFALDALPDPGGPVAVAGDAAIAVASRLAARDANVRLLDARIPTPAGVASAALRRAALGLPPRPAQPLYVDAPEARPGGGARPAAASTPI